MKNKNLLVFDIDGTIINTEKSYLEAIKLTVEHFIHQELDRKKIAQIKALPGFNNDWIAAYALINAELTGKDILDFKEKSLSQQIDFTEIKEIFQSYYLGNTLYQEIEGTNPKINVPSGLWEAETLLFTVEQLTELYATFGPLKIITGRTHKEAMHAIKHFQLEHLFDQVISVEDISDKWFSKHEELVKFGKDKQNPVLFYQIADISSYDCIYYLGDGVSDMQLAYNASPALTVFGIHLLEAFKKEQRIDIMNKTSAFSPYKTFATATEVYSFLLKA
ncbi:MAG: HAD hydrolase-like protein [Candidatus Margulisbacteria bacterium]|nr:HAD hydrolase-like protein [Candidatus Margulisiibacteriota bacterium]